MQRKLINVDSQASVSSVGDSTDRSLEYDGMTDNSSKWDFYCWMFSIKSSLDYNFQHKRENDASKKKQNDMIYYLQNKIEHQIRA